MNWRFWEKQSPASQKPEAAKTGFAGNDLIINPTPGQRRTRNSARIETLKSALASMASDHPERESFEKELKRRVLEAELESLKGGGV